MWSFIGRIIICLKNLVKPVTVKSPRRFGIELSPHPASAETGKQGSEFVFPIILSLIWVLAEKTHNIPTRKHFPSDGKEGQGRSCQSGN
jgi:hypothetical protein